MAGLISDARAVPPARRGDDCAHLTHDQPGAIIPGTRFITGWQ
jgi:hypothetical protein